MKNLRTYKALTAYGFSGFKALEIVVDARRGDEYALRMAKYILWATRANSRWARPVKENGHDQTQNLPRLH